MSFRALIAAILVGTLGCRFEGRISAGEIRCQSTSDCVDGRRCSPALGLCVEVSSDITPPTFRGLRLSPALGRAGTVFVGQLEVDEPVLTTPTLSLVFRDGTTELMSFDQGRYVWASDGGQREGDLRLRASAIDRAGNPGQAESSVLGQLDLTAPSVVASSLTYTSPTPAVPVVSELAPGGRATLALRFDEAVASPPSLELDPPGLAQSRLTDAGALQASWELSLTPAAQGQTGRISLRTSLVDAAGNVRNELVGEMLGFDAIAPSFVLDAGLTLIRAQQVDGVGAAKLMGRTEGATIVRVLSPDAGVELTRVVVGTDGAFDTAVPDLSRVLAEAFDQAGNASPLLAPSDVIWRLVASGELGLLGAAGPGLYRPDLQPLPLQYPAAARGMASWELVSQNSTAARPCYVHQEGQVLMVGAGFSRQAGDVWTQVPVDSLAGAAPLAVASDGVRSRLWTLADDGLRQMNERKQRRVPATGEAPPFAYSGFSMAALDGRLAVVGGLGAVQNMMVGDFAIRHPAMHFFEQGVWSKVLGLPSVEGSIVADSAQRVFYLSGSFDGGVHELWRGELDGGWRPFEPLPPGKFELVYISGRSVLWGGMLGFRGLEAFFEISADGGKQLWPIAPSAIGRRLLMGCTANEAAGSVLCLLVDADSRRDFAIREFFADGGVTFQPVNTRLHPPTGGARVAAGPGGDMWLHGGEGSGTAASGLYVFENGGYRALATGDAGLPRIGHLFAVNPDSGAVWVSGGFAVEATPLFSEWNNVIASSTATTWGWRPPGPWSLQSSSSASGLGVVVDGGLLSLSLLGSSRFENGAWVSLPQVNSLSGSLALNSTASSTGRVLSISIRQSIGAPPNPRLWSAAATETPIEWRVVTELPPGTSQRSALAFDEERNSLIAVGGIRSLSLSDEVVEFSLDGGVSRWLVSDPEGDGDMTQRESPRGFYEARKGRVLVVGGRDDGGSKNETWALNRALNRPAVRLPTSLSSVNVGPLDPIAITIALTASGQGVTADSTRVPLSGFEVVGYLDGAFRPLVRSNTNGSTTITLRGVTLSRLAPGGQLVVEVRPLGVNGAGEATVQVDAFAVTVTRDRP